MWMVVVLHNSHDKTVNIFDTKEQAEEDYKDWLGYYKGIEDMVGDVAVYMAKVEQSKNI